MCISAHPRFFALFTVLLVLAGCFTPGCSTPQPALNESHAATNTGFRVLSTESVFGGPQALSFKDATKQFEGVVLDGGNSSAVNTSTGKEILYIRGNDLNDNGQARSWAFVVRHANRTSLVTVDRQGMNLASWRDNFPQRKINLDAIILPEDLFLKNRATILQDPGDNRTGSRDLVLAMDRYTITTSGNVNRILIFDAKTGALMSSHG